MSDFDVVIRDGMVVDGTRSQRYRADVGIRDGRITRIGRLRSADAGRVLDASGMIVAPGFVDLHTHYDAQLFWDPSSTTSTGSHACRPRWRTTSRAASGGASSGRGAIASCW